MANIDELLRGRLLALTLKVIITDSLETAKESSLFGHILGQDYYILRSAA